MMREMRLTVLDVRESWTGCFELEVGRRAVAALNADPETVKEWGTAFSQFDSLESEEGILSRMVKGDSAFKHDAGIIWIDLAAKLVVHDLGGTEIDRIGSVSYGGRKVLKAQLRYRVDPSWMLTNAFESRELLAKRRRLSFQAQTIIDYRETLYGRPLIEFLLEEVLRACKECKDPRDFAETESLISNIHERWLLMPREEWNGLSPREVIVSQYDFLNFNMEDRREAWMHLDQPPVELPIDSRAYRFSGWGENEGIMYYDLIRHLLSIAWKEIVWDRQGSKRKSDEELVISLEREKERWLHEPILDFHGRTPLGIIERERRRLPEVVSHEEAMADCDCPLCAMVANMDAVSFWFLDGCHIENEYAFSFDGMWEAADFDSCIEEAIACQGPGDAGTAGVNLESDSPFGLSQMVSLSVDERSLDSMMQLFPFGCRLGELISVLKKPREQRPLIDAMLSLWEKLRESIGQEESQDNRCRLEAVLEEFHATLDAVLDSNPNTEENVVWLQKGLDQIADGKLVSH